MDRGRFADLLTVGGRLYRETHFAPLLRMQGEISGSALELNVADGTRVPVLVSSTVKRGGDGPASSTPAAAVPTRWSCCAPVRRPTGNATV